MNTEQTGKGALIVIPTYNEAENIRRIVPAVLDIVPDTHVLIVDDRSPDGTGQIADEMAESDSRLHVLHRPIKEGLGVAYRDGFRWALERDYLYVFEFDADFSHNPCYLPGMLALLENHTDVVVGSRRVDGGGVENWGVLRHLISWGGSVYARTVLGVPIRDLTAGFIGYKRKVLEALPLDNIQTAGYGFQIEMKYRAFKAGFRVMESPIVFPDRVMGSSKMSKTILIEALVNVWKLRAGK
jgi:dolichol-phosphate mannosyltransferase